MTATTPPPVHEFGLVLATRLNDADIDALFGAGRNGSFVPETRDGVTVINVFWPAQSERAAEREAKVALEAIGVHPILTEW